MTINVVGFDKFVELEFPSEDMRLSYDEAIKLRNQLNDVLKWRFEEVEE